MFQGYKRPIALIGTVVATVSLSACSNDQGDDGGSLPTITIARAQPINPSEVNDVVGPIEYGEQYGVKVTIDDIKPFRSGDLALQVLRSGEADVAAISTADTIAAINKGVEIQQFCPVNAGFANYIVGTGDVTSLDYLSENLDTPAAVESTGGSANTLWDLALLGRGYDFSVEDFTNTKILEDGDLRASALASGQANVAVISDYLLPEVEKTLGADNVHVLGEVMEDVPQPLVWSGYAATTEWLNDHEDEAAAVCAATLQASEELVADEDRFIEACDEYIVPKVDPDSLRTSWKAINKYSLYPWEAPLYSEESINAVVQVMMNAGTITEAAPYDRIVNTAVAEQATELLAQAD